MSKKTTLDSVIKRLSRKKPTGNRLTAGRRALWKPALGSGYDVATKHSNLRPILEQLDKLGKLGKVILDAGSGSRVMLTPHAVFTQGVQKNGIFYPTKGKKVIRMDVAFPPKVNRFEEGVEVGADIEYTRANTFGRKRQLVELARYIGINPRSKPAVDTILLSESLNYVNYKKTISGLSKYLKPGGRIVIFNKPGRGYSQYFSDKGVKTNTELVEFLKKSGFEIEHLAHPLNYGLNPAPAPYPYVGTVLNTEMLTLVARKK